MRKFELPKSYSRDNAKQKDSAQNAKPKSILEAFEYIVELAEASNLDKMSLLNTSIVKAQTELASAEENVTHDVRAAYIRYMNSFELLKTQEKSLQLARENYEVIANRYANDLVLVTDLVDADNLRLAAEVQYVNAQINVIYNYCKLLYESGALNSAKE